MSRVRETLVVAREGAHLAAANVIGGVLGLIYLLLSARMLGPTEFSDVTLCLSLSYVGLLFLGPLNLTLIRFSSTYRDAEATGQIRPLLRRSVRLYAPWVAAAITLSVIFASPLTRVLNAGSTTLIPWTALLVALSLALGAGRAVAIGMHEHRLYGLSLLVDTGLRVAGGLALVFAMRTASAAIAGFLLGAGAALSLLIARGRELIPATETPWADRSDVSRFMTVALVFSAVAAGLQNADMILVKARLTEADAGHYAVALAVGRSLLLLAGPFAGLALARERGGRAHASLVSFLMLACPIVAVLAVAPGPSLQLLYGGAQPAVSRLLPIIALAFLLAGAFLIAAHAEIRAGRFAFLVPAAAVLAAQQALLLLAPPSVVVFAWIVVGTHGAAAASVPLTPMLQRRLRRFEGSAHYWDTRYARGGTSGEGSQGKFAEFKAEVLNDFVRDRRVGSVIEFGCGDGRQLALARYPRYLGFDVSREAIRLCRQRYGDDPTKTFRLAAEYAGERADLVLSLDVVYHLVEDEVFDAYMRQLFDASTRWVIIYSSDRDDLEPAGAAHVRHRAFTGWVQAHERSWILRQRIANRYPFAGDYRLGSFSDFYVYERT